MAALSQTPANVRAVGTLTRVTAGEACSPGMPLYLKTSDQKYWKAKNTGIEEANCTAMSMTYASANDYVWVLTADGDTMNLGATLTVGAVYYVGTVAGTIEPVADIGTGDFVTSLGIAVSTSILVLNLDPSGIASA